MILIPLEKYNHMKKDRQMMHTDSRQNKKKINIEILPDPENKKKEPLKLKTIVKRNKKIKVKKLKTMLNTDGRDGRNAKSVMKGEWIKL
jgi:hypothetical protein